MLESGNMTKDADSTLRKTKMKGGKMDLLHTLFDCTDPTQGTLLTPALRNLFGGQLVLPNPRDKDRPYTVAIFVQTLDGVTAFNDTPGQDSGGDISNFNKADGFLLALLRCMVDAIIVGANTLRREPKHLWTPAFMHPEAATYFGQQRSEMGKGPNPLVAFLTRTGDLPADAPIFHKPDVKTTVFKNKNEQDVLRALASEHGVTRVLIEGPSVFSSFLKLDLVDELFITTVPRIAGNDRETARPTLGLNARFSPGSTPWWRLVNEKANLEPDGSIGSYRFFRFVRDRS